jgi:hypothetical protein
MSNFCLLAYIPCIILIIWLLFELRKYIIITKRLRKAKIVWANIQAQREKRKSDKGFIETIPPPPPSDYSGEYSRDEYPSSDDYYGYPDRAPRRSRRGPRPLKEDLAYDDGEYEDWNYDYDKGYSSGRPPRRAPSRSEAEYDRTLKHDRDDRRYDQYNDMKASRRRRSERGRPKYNTRKYTHKARSQEPGYNNDDSSDIDWD